MTFTAGQRLTSAGLNSSLVQLVSSQVLTSTQASVSFSGISATFSRLVLDWRARLAASGQQSMLMQIDGNTGSNYLWSNIQMSNTTVAGFSSGGATTSIQIGSADGNTANYFASGRQVIDGWSQSTGFLTTSGHWNSFSTSTTGQSGQIGGQFLVVGPHSSITVFASGVSFVAGSQFSLYGEP